ncbi:MAG: DUF1735 domain-containing protein [Bacteroides sp.]|uniref:BT_3987 domain-containing protein n=1 Tax=Bacteroides sp. TaxID=29523 RepID=UPI002FCADB2A
MKQIYYRRLFLVSAIALCMLGSCDSFDGVTDFEPDNGVYLEALSSTRTAALTLTKEGGEASFNVRLANPTTSDVTVELKRDEQSLSAFNKLNNTQLEAIPDSCYTLLNAKGEVLKGSVTIPAGEFSAKVIVRVKPLNETSFPLSGRYAIPFVATNASGDFNILKSSNNVLIQINRTIVTSVTELKGNGIRVYTDKDYIIPEWTCQVTAHYSMLGTYNDRPNLTIVYFGGPNPNAGAFYTRIIKGKLQVQSGRDGDDSWTRETDLIQGKRWIQITFVYNRKKMDIYINGELIHTFALGNIGISKGNGIALGNGGLRSGDYFRELRFWSKALTPQEINNYLYLPLDPQTPNLEMYLPLTKEVGIKDISHNNNKVEIFSGAQYQFIENVLFPSLELAFDKEETNNSVNESIN